MKKRELAEKIISVFDEAELRELESSAPRVPVSEYNMKTLLALADPDAEFEGEADESGVRELEELLRDFLERSWPEEPRAHKYVIASCLALAFIFGKPLHPEKAAHYHTVVENSAASYYCPAKEPGTLCDFCAAQKADFFTERTKRRCAETAARFGKLSAKLQEITTGAGFPDSGVLETKDIRCYDGVREMCEKNVCRAYGRTWACPPAVGTLEQCRARIAEYDKMLLFSRAYLLDGDMDFEGVREAMKDFKQRVRELDRSLGSVLPERLTLSNESCDICPGCSYPDSPCRFPQEMHPAIEGFGLNISELAGLSGVRYINGRSTVTFFGAVLYREKREAR